MKMLLLIAVRNLIQARRRTTLLSLALGSVSALLVLMFSLSQGVSDTMLHSATILASGHVNVAGFYKGTPEDAFPIVTERSKVRKAVEEIIGSDGEIRDRSRGWGKVISPASTLQAGVDGIDIKDEGLFMKQLQLAAQKDYVEGGSEKILGDLSKLSEPGTILLFAGQAKRLEVDIGDIVTMTSESLSGRVNTVDARIVAIAKDVGFMSNWSVFVPKSLIVDLYQMSEDTTGAIQVQLDNPDDSEKVMAKLRAGLEDAGFRLMEHDPKPFWGKFGKVSSEDWVGQKLDLTIWSDEVSFMKYSIDALDTISVFLVSILMVIIVVGIINTMLISVRERTSEIGSLRAIGMHRWEVLTMIMLEALVLALFATSVGALVGAGTASALDLFEIALPKGAVQTVLMSDTLHLDISFGQMLSSVLSFSFITVLAALWPAIRAAQLEPVKAIHKT